MIVKLIIFKQEFVFIMLEVSGAEMVKRCWNGSVVRRKNINVLKHFDNSSVI